MNSNSFRLSFANISKNYVILMSEKTNVKVIYVPVSFGFSFHPNSTFFHCKCKISFNTNERYLSQVQKKTEFSGWYTKLPPKCDNMKKSLSLHNQSTQEWSVKMAIYLQLCGFLYLKDLQYVTDNPCCLRACNCGQ